jgi:hypothetical protein
MTEPANPEHSNHIAPRAPLFRSALKVVTPAHISGRRRLAESSSGTSASAWAGATMYSA